MKTKKSFFKRSLAAASVAILGLAGFAAMAASNITIEGAKGYFSNITLYSSDGRTVNAGPVIGTADVSGNYITVKVSGLPQGTYNRVKVTLSGNPNSNDAVLKKNNSFAVTGSIAGKDIDYASKKTVTKDLRFNKPVTVGSDEVLTMSASVDLSEAFNLNGKVLDPDNPSNLKSIGRNLGKILKNAFDIQ